MTALLALNHFYTFSLLSLVFAFCRAKGNRNQRDKYYKQQQNTDVCLCNMHARTHALSPLPDLEVLSIEGQRAADQCVEDHPQAPDVHLRPVVLLALEELWGSVGRGAAECVQLVPQSELITEAKVSYFDVHVCIQQQVLRLQTEET